jgi:hypothetical protein
MTEKNKPPTVEELRAIYKKAREEEYKALWYSKSLELYAELREKAVHGQTRVTIKMSPACSETFASCVRDALGNEFKVSVNCGFAEHEVIVSWVIA